MDLDNHVMKANKKWYSNKIIMVSFSLEYGGIKLKIKYMFRAFSKS